ncbi:alpha/beta hydrolase [Ideonella sp. A 288]|uniref:alpha/beta hydrolase n=1 Tax=Ideonella sp. A 288 TaxID=1962181 RepID=UPI000B4C1B96|nr:alpha/beta fold hydrolase [Ideonella sp. A 288]
MAIRGLRRTWCDGGGGRVTRVLAAAAVLMASATVRPQGLSLVPCKLDGVEHEARCGVVRRALDPSRPQGTAIDVHVAVLPAVARRKASDPVFFFAGGPGQSAIDLAGPLSRRFARLSNRRDLVFVDQRGTGRSAPLKCADDDLRSVLRPMAETADEARRLQRLRECAAMLQALPHGDLRRYTTAIAMADVDAVRAALGVERLNAIGASYGTRAVLEYQRQFPQRVRRAVLDGVAPADMVLPASFSPDNQAALEAVFAACEQEDACKRRYPMLRQRWQALLARLPMPAVVPHPVSGREERVTVTRELLLSAVRTPLYVPLLASALPAALDEAADGRFAALVGLGQAMSGSGRGAGLATGMHFSVVCAEDVPRLAGDIDRPGADFGQTFAALYRQVCEAWPKASVPPAFFQPVPALAATLLLSGGADPATPPRHGDRVATALGPKARHVVVPQAGHGVLALGCVRDAVQRFIDADTDDAALAVDVSCAAAMPRPPAFIGWPAPDEAAR